MDWTAFWLAIVAFFIGVATKQTRLTRNWLNDLNVASKAIQELKQLIDNQKTIIDQQHHDIMRLREKYARRTLKSVGLDDKDIVRLN